MASDNALERVQRFLVLVPWLLANPGVTVREAAARFGVTTQQIKADLQDICESETPGLFFDDIVRIAYWRSDDGFDDDCPIFVHQPLSFDKPTPIPADTAAQLVLGLDVLEQMLGGTSAAVQSARQKLTKITEDGSSTPVVVSKDLAGAQVLPLVMSALASRSCVEIDYLPGDRDEVTTRTIEPLSISTDAGITTVRAWCHAAQAVRSFRLDRVLAVRSSDTPPTQPDGLSVQDQSFVDTAELTLSVAAPTGSAWVFDGLPGATVTAGGDRLHAQVLAGSLEWAVRWALRHADVVEVLEPASVRAEIVRRVSQARVGSQTGSP